MGENHIESGSLFEAARLRGALDALGASHLEHCPMCAGRLGWMKMMARFGPEESAYDPPESVMKDVLLLARDTPALKRLRNFVTAVLTFDSFAQPLDVRHSEAGVTSRHLTYETADVEIGIWIRRSDEKTVALAGQVISKSSAITPGEPDRVDVVLDGEHLWNSPLSQWGEFVFANLPSAGYALQVSLAGLVIQIPAIPMLP